jgi:hypothetical protein
MATRLVASVTALILVGCSSGQDNSNQVSPYGGASGASGAAGDAGNAGASGASGAGGSSGSGIAGIGGGISTEGGAGTDGGMEGCAKSTATAKAQPAVLELVVDTSGSMNQRPPNGTQTKWVSTRDSLVTALGTIPDGNALGLFFYPGNAGGATCIDSTPTVPIAALEATHRQTLLDRLNGQRTNGGTPTHDAYMVGLNELVTSTLPGNKYLVLITDGAPTYSINCVGDGQTQVDSTALIQQVQNAAGGGIKTFVIGSPGSEPARGDLSRMATVGMTPQPNCSDTGPNYCHFDMTTQTDLATALKNALSAITGQVLTCNYALPQPGAGQTLDLRKVNVRHNGADIPKDPSDADCNTGWNYSPDKKQIILCGDKCNEVKSQGGDIEIVFGCATKVF